MLFQSDSPFRDLSGNVVHIFVGHKEKRYSVHESRLSACCQFFFQKLRDANQEGPGKPLYLPDDNPDAFEIFANWLYKGYVKPVNATTKFKESDSGFIVDHYATVDPYFELYFMAEERGLVELKNHTIDVLRAYISEQNFVLSP